MELLLSPKSTYLLDASVEVLHEQSIEWLNEIAFWRDESAFLYSLFANKTLKFVPVNSKKDIEKIEKELLAMTCEDLDKLQHEVEDHEKFLDLLLKNDHLDKETYKRKHHALTLTFSEFEKRFKFLKKEIFALAEAIDKTKSK